MVKDTAMPRSPRFLQRSRSGTPRPRSAIDPLPFSPNRPRSAAKSRPVAGAGAAAASRRRPKENREEAAAVPPAIAERRPPVVASKSAWELSPGRSPADPAGGRRRGGVLSFLRNRKGSSERDEATHRLRVMTARLMQWRFANARAEAAMAASQRSAERKSFFALLRINELRNIVTAKRILIQRRRHKMKLFGIIGPQLQLLNWWEPIAKKNAEDVGALARVLETACISVPLIEGAQVDIMLVHEQICEAMDIMKSIQDVLRLFYDKVEKISMLLDELSTTIRSEMEGLKQLLRTSSKATLLKVHDLSLRAHQIQATREKFLTSLRLDCKYC